MVKNLPASAGDRAWVESLSWVVVVACRLSVWVTRAPECTGSGVVARGLGCPASMWGLSSLSRVQTCVPCIARWILNHWTASGPFFLVHVCVCVLGFLVCGYCEVFFLV